MLRLTQTRFFMPLEFSKGTVQPSSGNSKGVGTVQLAIVEANIWERRPKILKTYVKLFLSKRRFLNKSALLGMTMTFETVN